MVRHTDMPRFKESVIAELHGKFSGFLDAKGLTDGKEYKSQVIPVLSCSKRYVHVWDKDDKRDCQLVVYLSSTQFMLEFGVHNKKKKETIYRNKLENLRYKISAGTIPELIDSHQEKFKLFFEDFKNKFNELKKSDTVK